MGTCFFLRLDSSFSLINLFSLKTKLAQFYFIFRLKSRVSLPSLVQSLEIHSVLTHPVSPSLHQDGKLKRWGSAKRDFLLVLSCFLQRIGTDFTLKAHAVLLDL